jgi:hypothetical protein
MCTVTQHARPALSQMDPNGCVRLKPASVLERVPLMMRRVTPTINEKQSGVFVGIHGSKPRLDMLVGEKNRLARARLSLRPKGEEHIHWLEREIAALEKQVHGQIQPILAFQESEHPLARCQRRRSHPERQAVFLPARVG